MLDCMIASVAKRYAASLLAYDADLCWIAQIVSIEMDAASLIGN